jgi:hypothetical protein
MAKDAKYIKKLQGESGNKYLDISGVFLLSKDAFCTIIDAIETF